MKEVFQYVAKINNPFSLAAFAVAATLYLLLRKRGKIPTLAWICIMVLVLGAILSAAYVDVFRLRSKDASMYRVRVTVMGPNGAPVEQAQIWSSVGGEPKKVSAGWEFDIPASITPRNGKVTIFAASPPIYPSAQAELELRSDYNPTATVQFRKAELVSIRGIVINESQKGIEGVKVKAVGYETEIATTQKDGDFVLQKHFTDGQQVLLRAERKGYAAVEQYHPAGAEPVTIVLTAR
jgi:hypothetical protein